MGYRGEWEVRFKVTIPTEIVMDLHKNSEEVQTKYKGWIPKIYEVGDKIAQISFEYVNKVNFIKTAEFSDSERMDKGFGESTGK